MAQHRTIAELEADVGGQVRVLRTRAGLTQRQLARDAGVTQATIHKLEAGTGSNLRTLISVLRALDRTDWLDELGPPATISPMALLAEQKGQEKK